MGNIATRQSRHSDDRDRTTSWELHRLLVNLCQIRIERTRHRVFRRDLVHTVGDNRQGIGIVGHIGQQNEHLLVLLHGEILRSRQRHIRNQDTLHRGILRRIDEADDTIQRTGVAEGILEEEVIVVRHTHTTQDDLIRLGTQGHHRHHLVERLVRICEEGDLLTRHQCVVQVDTSDTGSDQLRGLLTTHGIHRGTANLHLTSFRNWSAINRIAIGIEETSCQLVTHLQRGSLAHEHYLGVGADTLRSGENL